MNAHLRRKRLQRFLSPKERKVFVCRNKRAFASSDEALACQPAQTPYRCRACGQWHLASTKKG